MIRTEENFPREGGEGLWPERAPNRSFDSQTIPTSRETFSIIIKALNSYRGPGLPTIISSFWRSYHRLILAGIGLLNWRAPVYDLFPTVDIHTSCLSLTSSAVPYEQLIFSINASTLLFYKKLLEICTRGR